MRDIHCHILPGVDDGSRNMQESLAMVKAAQMEGITHIVCTPHCRDPWFDYEEMWQAFYELDDVLDTIPGAPLLTMGFEVNYKKLKELGTDWIDVLCFESGEFLLELPTSHLPMDWERVVYEIQGKGHQVIIAHPERYKAVQDNISIAEDFVQAGCQLQISADFMAEGMFSPIKRTAKKLFGAGLVTYVASDAHGPFGYKLFAEVNKRFRY